MQDWEGPSSEKKNDCRKSTSCELYGSTIPRERAFSLGIVPGEFI